jgi:hypothetical protein
MKIFEPLTTHCPSRSPRLGQAERREPAARGEIGQPLLFLFFVPEVEDRQRSERVMRGDRDRNRRVDPRQLLDRDRVGERVGAAAAVFLRDRHTHQAEVGELGDELVGKAVLSVELLGNRRDPRLGEFAHGVADELLLGREVEVQAAATSRSASSQIRRTP